MAIIKGDLPFAANENHDLYCEQDTTASTQYARQIRLIGAKGADAAGGYGGDAVVAGGDAGANSNADGGTVFLRGGNKNGTGRYGGLDVGYTSTGNIYLGGSLDNSDGGVIYPKGEFAEAIRFLAGSGVGTAAVTATTPTALSGGGTLVEVRGGDGGPSDAGNNGGVGAVGRVRGGAGGNGTATSSPGSGGAAVVKGGAGGAHNGFGIAYGGNAEMQVGAGPTDNGAINIGTDTVPNSIHIGQASAPISMDGAVRIASGAGGLDMQTAVPLPLGQTNATFVNFHKKVQCSSSTAWNIADPGTGAAIPVTASGVCNLTVGAGAETNTLAAPTFQGQTLDLNADTVGGGTRAVTVSAAFNQAGNTVITFNGAGDYVRLVGVTIAGALRWRLVTNDGCALT